MRRVLITGAAGFVGANLTRRMLAAGHEVHVMLRPGQATWRIDDTFDHLERHYVDLADDPGISRIVRETRPDWIFHLAAHGAYPTQRDVRRMITTNILGTVNVVEAALATGCDVFVNAGSSSEYGYKDHAPSENESIEPNSAYAVTKASATMYCRQLARARGAKLVTLRLYSVYGPYEEPSRLLPRIVSLGLRGELPPLASPTIARDFVYVDDVLDAFTAVCTTDGIPAGSIYNVGSGRQTTIRDLVAAVQDVLAFSGTPEWGSMPDRDWDTTVWVADVRRIHDELTWRASTALGDGIRKMAAWLEANPAMLEFYSSG